ncbi:MAG TPA: LuxR C-terminal-related transcriptional regulator [Arachnia sp.]|nr:LuxR C-terminal-related transcriptional regulator [Arachnia sp.]HMT86527.1 LuxR C-terminal-related transcriptional regulator [Arachnia sp.]
MNAAERIALLAGRLDVALLQDPAARVPVAIVDQVWDLLNQREPREREWTLRLGAYRTLTPGLIERLGPGAPEAVASLAETGLLEPAGRAASWRVPLLLHRVVVQQQDDLSPGRTREIHDEIVEALLASEEQGLEVEAIYHAHLAHRWDALALLWNRSGVGLAARHPLLTAWAFRAPPPWAVRRYPVLRLAELIAEVSADVTPAGANQALLRTVAEAATAQQIELSVAADIEAVLSTGTLAVIALRQGGDIAGANHWVDVVESEVRLREEAARRQSRVLFALEAAVTRALAGRFVDVRYYAGTIVAETAGAVDLDEPRAQAEGLLDLVNSLLGWVDDREDAEPVEPGAPARSRLLARAHKAADALDQGQLDRLIVALGDPEQCGPLWPFLVVARVLRAILFGDPLGQIPELDRLSSHFREWMAEDALPARLILRCRTEALLAGGDTQRTAGILQARSPLPKELRVPQARLLLHTGDVSGALSYAEEILADPAQTPRERATFQVIAAAALHRLGRSVEAATLLDRMLAGGSPPPGWSVQMAMLEVSERQALLAMVSPGQVPDGLRRRLVDLAGPLGAARRQIVRLSARERVVLAELNSDRTLAQIAAGLSVSLNTVKKQSIAIYRELGVNDRAAALRRAHELGLLEWR